MPGQMIKAKVEDIMVATSGCAGLCACEPMVTVEVINEPLSNTVT